MDVTPKSRLQLRLQNALFVILFLGVIGLLTWLSTRYNYEADWTAGGRNTLSPASQTLLKKLAGPVTFTAYARETGTLRRQITELVNHYRRYKPDIELRFVNPDTDPERVRQLGVTVDGELHIAYAGRNTKVQSLSEQTLSNALQRVARSEQHWVVFLSGHGERNPHGAANHDLGDLGRHLLDKGVNVQILALTDKPQIPVNTTVLVIAGPQVDLLPGEVNLIQDYIRAGGNLLWLNDPGPLHGLEPVAEQLGIEFQPGVIVEPAAQLLGIKRPDVVLVAEYPPHPVTQDLHTLTVFPQASGMDLKTPEGWQGRAFLESGARSWSETGDLNGEIALDRGMDVAGPLAIGVSLTREAPQTFDAQGSTNVAGGRMPEATGSAGADKKEQRIVVMGDGDFLSNTFLGNGGNLDLGLNIVNWLNHDDTLIAVGARTAPDTTLNLSRTATAVIGLGFLFFLPLLLLGFGLTLWLKRRKR
ncbi:MAG: GldG family protein [Gammaproteobacteria bacterium]|nr:GldG family protein [Gammaproteobacteria bacterium]